MKNATSVIKKEGESFLLGRQPSKSAALVTGVHAVEEIWKLCSVTVRLHRLSPRIPRLAHVAVI